MLNSRNLGELIFSNLVIVFTVEKMKIQRAFVSIKLKLILFRGKKNVHFFSKYSQKKFNDL